MKERNNIYREGDVGEHLDDVAHSHVVRQSHPVRRHGKLPPIRQPHQPVSQAPAQAEAGSARSEPEPDTLLKNKNLYTAQVLCALFFIRKLTGTNCP